MEEVSKRFAQGVKDLGLDAIVVVGGDGSMNIVSNYCKGTDVKVIGIPKTIDNDTPITEFSVGFQTAVQVCTQAVDDLEWTARSHNRALIMEVMGRDAGHLAMHILLWQELLMFAWFLRFLIQLMGLSPSSNKSKPVAAATLFGCFWGYPKPKMVSISQIKRTWLVRLFMAVSDNILIMKSAAAIMIFQVRVTTFGAYSTFWYSGGF